MINSNCKYADDICNFFDMKSSGYCHDLYAQSDTLSLFWRQRQQNLWSRNLRISTHHQNQNDEQH